MNSQRSKKRSKQSQRVYKNHHLFFIFLIFLEDINVFLHRIVFTIISYICIRYIFLVYVIYHINVIGVERKCLNGKP